MNVFHVVGSRPAFLSLSPVIRALRGTGAEQTIVYAGASTDLSPRDRFLVDLDLPEPDFVLGGGGGSSALRTGRAVIGLEPIVTRSSPDWIFAVGDVDAALAAALVARKNGIPLAHLEAGLRTGDDSSSTEINRLLTDRLADVLFTAESRAHDVLRSEGIPSHRIHFVGNVLADAVDLLLDRARELDLPALMQLDPGSYVLALLRPGRGADADELAALLVALEGATLESGRPLLLVMEPALAADIRGQDLEHLLAPLTVIEPVGYVELLGLVEGAGVVVTDAAELPDVAALLGVPCVTVSEEPLHAASGPNGAGSVVTRGVDGLVEATVEGLGSSRDASRPELWDGHAAERIADIARALVVES
jgi:UDP-N-acetylglucosamine 2-epimerase (non-hydrolysing)